MFLFLTIVNRYIDKKEEIWPSAMTKAPTPTEMSKGQSDNTNNATKSSIKQQLRTDLGLIVIWLKCTTTDLLLIRYMHLFKLIYWSCSYTR